MLSPALQGRVLFLCKTPTQTFPKQNRPEQGVVAATPGWESLCSHLATLGMLVCKSHHCEHKSTQKRAFSEPGLHAKPNSSPPSAQPPHGTAAAAAHSLLGRVERCL